jgi:hypothetical protein
MRKRRYARYLRLISQDGQRIDEMATFDAAMELDEALDRIVTDLRRQPTRSEERDRALIAAWLADLSRTVRQ